MNLVQPHRRNPRRCRVPPKRFENKIVSNKISKLKYSEFVLHVIISKIRLKVPVYETEKLEISENLSGFRHMIIIERR